MRRESINSNDKVIQKLEDEIGALRAQLELYNKNNAFAIIAQKLELKKVDYKKSLDDFTSKYLHELYLSSKGSTLTNGVNIDNMTISVNANFEKLVGALPVYSLNENGQTYKDLIVPYGYFKGKLGSVENLIPLLDMHGNATNRDNVDNAYVSINTLIDHNFSFKFISTNEMTQIFIMDNMLLLRNLS